MSGKRLYTHSASKSFRTCNYQYYLAYILGFKPVKSGDALAFGTLIHKCLEAYWLARKSGSKNPIEAALTTLASLTKTMDIYLIARAKIMLLAYASVWDATKFEVLSVEAKFITPLMHPETREVSDRFERAGKLDLVGRLEDRRIALVEHKTSAMEVGEGSDYRRRLTLDEQISFYYAGAISLGYRPDIVIYDVLKKFRKKPKLATPEEKRVYVIDKKTKEKRLRANQRERDETVDEYEKRLFDDVVKDPQAYIERIGIQRLPAERKRFALDVWNQSKLMVYAIDGTMFPRNSDACFRYGSPCGYVKHCMEGAQLEDPTLYQKFGNDVHRELVDDEEEEETDSDDSEESEAE